MAAVLGSLGAQPASGCLGDAGRAELPPALWLPQNDLDYAARFLHMLFAWPTCSYEVDPVLARALDKILILCAIFLTSPSLPCKRLLTSMHRHACMVPSS